jgi:Flp pilus assembly protein TadD
LRRYPEAITEAERAEGLDSVNPFMMLGTSWVHTQAGQFKRADEALGRWLELDSTSATAYGLLGWVQVQEGWRAKQGGRRAD